MLVLVFSSYLLFQNVYTTFKALRPPKPSRKSKNGIDPAVKAKAARKRELKGMLACWIVWSCWTSAEAIADRTIAILTPFYSEIKMFLILFLIIGRSTMAEPILLHVIRPLLKPYYVSLDSCVDIFTSGADLAVLLFTVPAEWIRIVTQKAWATLRKTFTSGSASLPRPGGHAVSASDPDEPLSDPITPGEPSATAGPPAPDPLQRFIPKTRAYAPPPPESDDEEMIYKNPLRDDPPPYGLGLPADMPISRERDYPPVFSAPRTTSRATSRSRPETSTPSRARRMSVDHRQPYLPDTSTATSVSYRPESEVGMSSYAFSPGSQGISYGAGDLAPDPDIPSFALSSPEHPPVSVPATPAVRSYLQPRTRASRANLNPNRQRVDSYVDAPNARAAFVSGEKGMTFADGPKETKGLTPEVVSSYGSQPPSDYGFGSPPVQAAAPSAYNNPYAVRGRTGHPTARPYGSSASSSTEKVDLIQGWLQHSAQPHGSKHKRQPSAGPAGSTYPYQAAQSPYAQSSPSLASFASPSIPPSLPPSFPTPSVASLAPSQSISNVHARPPQPGQRPTVERGRAPGPAPSHPPTSTTGMGMAPRRRSSTRELRAQVWDPKEDSSAADAERAREEERKEAEKKEAERENALERQRRKVSDSQQYQRTVRLRGRGKDRALRGVGSVRVQQGKSSVSGGEATTGKDETNEGVDEGSSPARAIVVEGVDEGRDLEGSPSKRRRVGEGGESVPTGAREAPARRNPTRVPVVSRASGHASKVVPAKRPIDAAIPKRPAKKPPVPKLGRSAPKPIVTRAPGNTRPIAPAKIGPSAPGITATARSAGPARPKPVISKSAASEVTKT